MKFISKVLSFTYECKYPLLKVHTYDFDNNTLEVKIYDGKLNDVDLFNEENYVNIHSPNIYNLSNYENNVSFGLLRLVLIYAPIFKDKYKITKYKCEYSVDDVIDYISNLEDYEIKYIIDALLMQSKIGDLAEDYDIDSVIDIVKNININLYKEMIMEYKLRK